MIAWRVSRHRNLDGVGGLRASGRWHTKGHAITYTSEHPGTVVLEWLAGLEAKLDEAPSTIPFMKIEIPDGIATNEITDASLSPNWQGNRGFTQSLGDRWIERGKCAVLVVPSVLLPARNILINPNHPDADDIVVVDRPDFPFDPRLLR